MREKKLQIMFSESEHEYVQKAANLSAEKVASFVRRAAIKAANEAISEHTKLGV